MGVLEIIKGAKFPETTAHLCMRQDLDMRIRELMEERLELLADRKKNKDDRLASAGESSARADEIDEEIKGIKDQMLATTIDVHMRGVASAEYNVMQRTAGKPRPNVKADQEHGYDLMAFYINLIKRCTYKITSPDGDEVSLDDEGWKSLLESINDAQFDELCIAVNKINRETANPTLAGLSSALFQLSAQK